MLNFDGGVEAVKLILKFQKSSVSDGTNLYKACEECVELTQIGILTHENTFFNHKFHISQSSYKNYWYQILQAGNEISFHFTRM